MLVSELIEQVRDDALETSAAGIATDTRVLRCINEAIRHLRQVIIHNDPSGDWLGEEADYTYPAATRWVDLDNWSTNGAPNKIVSLVNLDGELPIEFTDSRKGARTSYQGNSGNIGAHLKGQQLGLRVIGSDSPPAAAVRTRMVFIPPHVALDSGDMAVDVGSDIPFPVDHLEAVVAYAVVRLIMQTESPVTDFQRRYNQLERDLIDTISQRRQSYTSPTVNIGNPWWC